MAAGLGFKDFVTGEVLTAADVDGYLMQGIWVFASAAARDAAVTSPQEGNFAYLKDTNTTTYYTGSAWTNLDTTGMVNPMTTTGDTIYSSSGSTPARLGIGTAGQVLTVNSGATAPEWATPASSGGMTSIASGSLSGSSVALTSIVGTYKDLKLYVNDVNCSTNGSNVRITVNSLADYDRTLVNADTTSTVFDSAFGTSVFQFQASPYKNGDFNNAFNMIFHDYTNTDANKLISSYSFSYNVADKKELDIGLCAAKTTSAITSITISVSGGTFTGTYNLFGVK